MTNLWNNPDVPHKGWHEETVIDTEAAVHTCEMCNKEEIRFIHVMLHPEHSEALHVGCVCAEKMSNDYISSQKNLKRAKLLANNKKTWLRDSTWQHAPLRNFLYRESRTITSKITVKKSKILYWEVCAVNGKNLHGHAYNVFDAMDRVAECVKTMQIN